VFKNLFDNLSVSRIALKVTGWFGWNFAWYVSRPVEREG